MAIMSGMNCMNCKRKGITKPARDLSHFCTEKCGEEFCRFNKGPIQCEFCSAECDTVAKARKEKWRRIQMDPEGISCNYSGVCPECAAHQGERQ